MRTRGWVVLVVLAWAGGLRGAPRVELTPALKAAVFHPCSLEMSWQAGEAQGLECPALAPAVRALGRLDDAGVPLVRAARQLLDYQASRARRVTLSREYTPCLARPGALTTIYAFLDYTCGPCRALRFRLYDLVARQPVRVCIKNFPTGVMAAYPLSPLVAVAADLQGSFAPAFEALFRKRGVLEDRDALALARALKLDEARFNADLGSEAVKSVVLRDAAEGGRLGVSGTPTLVAGSELFTDLEGLEHWVIARVERARHRAADNNDKNLRGAGK
jgi:protein-disulfide isomerase